MKSQSGKIRIISGENKGRVLQFPAINGLRPTPDRIRETLFNWLAPYISNSICLDLFAGSGALGFEALSRGAKEVVFVESNRQAAYTLEHNSQLQRLDSATIINQNSAKFLMRCTSQFDIVFLDPPFNSDLLQASVDLINKQNLIKKNGWVYAEYSTHMRKLKQPEHWTLYRQTKAGDAHAQLFQINADNTTHE